MTADSRRKKVIGVIGGSQESDDVLHLAHQVGTHIAGNGAVLVCGGLGGVMEAASRGASENGGMVVGIVPGESAVDANPWVDIVIPSGLGVARNVLIIRTSDVLIALPGSFGTLSEIALSLNTGKTVIFLPGVWDLRKIHPVDGTTFKEAFSAHQAVGMALDTFRQ